MSAQSKQVVVRPTSNDCVREYHIIGETISELPYREFWYPMYDESKSESEFDELGTKGKQVATKLMTKGNEKSISRIVFRPNSVRIYKTPISDWTSVETGIVIPVLKATLGAGFKPVQYGTTRQRELALV